MSNKNIKITGLGIIGDNGKDNTGALKELGIKKKPKGPHIDQEIADMEFLVDLGFVLRHELLDTEIYEKYYKKSDVYAKYFKEGEEAYLAGKDDPCDNPYSDISGKMMEWSYPWFDGFRAKQNAVMEEKYKISSFQKQVRDLAAKAGVKIAYCDEYGTPYGITPEGYKFKLT